MFVEVVVDVLLLDIPRDRTHARQAFRIRIGGSTQHSLSTV